MDLIPSRARGARSSTARAQCSLGPTGSRHVSRPTHWAPAIRSSRSFPFPPARPWPVRSGYSDGCDEACRGTFDGPDPVQEIAGKMIPFAPKWARFALLARKLFVPRLLARRLPPPPPGVRLDRQFSGDRDSGTVGSSRAEPSHEADGPAVVGDY
ncbi:hypothetical protein NL676_006687 [Syzygium grande]|nr:hypothetical protein NL676_006687 [Syzygium grande]